MLTKFPLIGFFLFFLTGIMLAGFLGNVWSPFDSMLVVFISILWIVFEKVKPRKRFALFLTALLLGFLNTQFKGEKPNNTIGREALIAKVQLLEKPIEKKNSYKANAKIVSWLSAEKKALTKQKVILYFEKSPRLDSLFTEDEVQIEGRFQKVPSPKNPNEFNYKAYLSLQGIGHQIYLKTDKWKAVKTGNFTLKSMADRIRFNLLQKIESFGFEPQETAVLQALLTGYKNNLDEEIMTSYASAGAMHVLAVSGLHVGILYLILSQLLMPLKKYKYGRVFALWFVLLSIWSYALVTGLSDSVVRAATMFTFVHLGTSLKRKTNIYNTIVASALLLLIVNPNYIFMVGFQLSYSAVLGIVYLQPKIYGFLPKPKFWLLDKMWAITCVSIAAQLATFPFSLYYFHQFPVLFLFSNVIVIPLVWLIMVAGFALLFFSSFLPIPSFILIGYQLLVAFMNKSVAAIDAMPFSVIRQVSIGRVELVFLYVLIGLFLVGIIQRKTRLFILGAWLTLMFLSFQIIDGFHHKKQLLTVIYATGNEACVAFIDGETSVMLADETLLSNEDKMMFHIRHHQWALGIKNTLEFDFNKALKLETKNLVVDGIKIRVSEKKWALYKNESDSTSIKIGQPDFLVVYKNLKPFRCEAQVVLTSALSQRNIDSWALLCPKLQSAKDAAVVVSIN